MDLSFEIFKFLGVMFNPIYSFRNDLVFKKLRNHLSEDEDILDVGAGTCRLTKKMMDKGFKLLPLDVENRSFVNDVKPRLYNGKNMPFKKNEFDASLLLVVLHHTNNPKKVLKEAKRVSDKIIVMEDIWDNVFHKYITFFWDSLVNFEFRGHPRSNKTDKEWKETFKDLGLKLKHSEYFWVPPMKHGFYVLDASK